MYTALMHLYRLSSILIAFRVLTVLQLQNYKYANSLCKSKFVAKSTVNQDTRIQVTILHMHGAHLVRL